MAKNYSVSEGVAYPLGSSWDGEGANFAIFSKNASKVELCLFDTSGKKELKRIPVPFKTADVWHCYVKGLKLGQIYGYRVYGDYAPWDGKKFNPNKLLLDPYAKAVFGDCKWHESMYAYERKPFPDINSFSSIDSAPFMPKAMLVDTEYDWQEDKCPNIPWKDTIIYELNVKGFTKLNKKIPEAVRGKFAGLAQPEVIEYLKKLGITTLELLPCQNFFTNQPQMDMGLSNYWGYDSLCFFAPHNDYLASGDIAEFKDMVKELHKEGIEVILDVVFNHTTESNAFGPTLCFKGIDNQEYYKPVPDNKNYYIDDTGCGASFNVYNPRGLQLVMDALRYWAEEMHVDGFRFDLATTLCRGWTEVEAKPAFLKAVLQDPILGRLKLIAEPWDLGPNGYRLGFFSSPWLEWNDKFRDTVRKFWAGHTGQVFDLAKRIAGSRDIFTSRPTHSSVNFITAHDGFTLADLVAYNCKHNEANGEANRDGADVNYSFNSGVEGKTRSPKVLALRELRKRSLFATLMLSAGTPMMLYGDECSRSQEGNNNSYCQDNELTWLNLKNNYEKDSFWNFVREIIKFRKENNVFDEGEYTFFTPSATQMTDEDLKLGYSRTLSFTVKAKGISLFIVMNGYEGDINWHLPSTSKNTNWRLVFDTKNTNNDVNDKNYTNYNVSAWSFVLFKLV